MKTQEKQTLLTFAAQNNLTAFEETDYGMFFDVEGFEWALYIFNEGQGWMWSADEGGDFVNTYDNPETLEKTLESIDLNHIEKVYQEKLNGDADWNRLFNNLIETGIPREEVLKAFMAAYKK